MKMLQKIVALLPMAAGWTCATIVSGWKVGIFTALKPPEPQPMRIVGLRTDDTISSSKALRVACPGMGLKEAKDICDRLRIEGRSAAYTLPLDVPASAVASWFLLDL